MAIKIVTDSSSDIPRSIAEELDITVVPLYVQFGSVTYRDGVDIEPAQVMDKLEHESTYPTTSAASPGDFAEIYQKLCQGNEGIISIHLSSKLSATFDSALKGKEIVSDNGCPIEVVDSKLVSIAMGLVTIAAAKAANAGKSMQNILDNINQVIPNIRAYGLLDGLKYIAKSGRLGKVGPLLSSILPVKPVLTIKNGLLSPVGVVRTRSKGLERLTELIRSLGNIKGIGISHSLTNDEVESFVDRLKSFLPNINPTITKLGPALGVHGGPGTILVAIQQDSDQIETNIESKEKKPLVSLPSLQSIKEGILQRSRKDSSFLFNTWLSPSTCIR